MRLIIGAGSTALIHGHNRFRLLAGTDSNATPESLHPAKESVKIARSGGGLSDNEDSAAPKDRTMTEQPGTDPHAGQSIQHWGSPLHEATAALIVVHGRGAPALSMLPLATAIAVPGVAVLAPEAIDNTWYPYSFLAPTEANEPHLSSALALVRRAVEQVVGAGIDRQRLMILGFSQGACLTLEFAARNPARYGGVIGFSGGLIGPKGTVFAHPGSFDGTPVFLGVSDNDPHIPVSRVDESAEAFTRMGAQVTSRLYPGTGHTILDDEVQFARALMATLLPPA
jgi:predicted esterase